MEQDLDEIYPSLHITASFNYLYHGVDMEFRFTLNYPKGRGTFFMVPTRINNPGAYLMQTMRALGGSRQDLFLEVAPSVFTNRVYYMDFLMENLCVTENLLQNNLFGSLQSVEMSAVL